MSSLHLSDEEKAKESDVTTKVLVENTSQGIYKHLEEIENKRDTYSHSMGIPCEDVDNDLQQCQYYGFVGISCSITLSSEFERNKFTWRHINIKELSEKIISLRSQTKGNIKSALITPPPSEARIFLEEMRSSYQIPYEYTKILDFSVNGELNNWPNPQTEPWTKRRLRINKNANDNSLIFNAFFVDENLESNFLRLSNLYLVTYDIMLLISLRQWELFLDSYMFRMYDVFLPPAKIILSTDDPKKDKINQGKFIGIPYVSIRKKPNLEKEAFSGTLCLSLILISTDESYENKRAMDFQELHKLTIDDTKIKLEGDSPLIQFINARLSNPIFAKLNEKSELIRREISQEIPLRHLFKILSFLIYTINEEHFDENVWSTISNRMYDSFQYLKVVDVECNGFGDRLLQDVRDFYKKSLESDQLRRLLNVLVAPQHQLNYNLQLDTVNFPSLVINDPSHLDVTVKAFYNPFENLDATFMFRSDEKFPMNSIKWALSWHMKLIQSLSALTSLKNNYYYELEHSKPLSETLSEIENKMLRDLDDFYDLEIREWAYSYRMEFEKAKQLLGINLDFQNLKEKTTTLRTIVQSHTQTKLIEEGARINKRISRLTMAVGILTATLIALEIYHVFF